MSAGNHRSFEMTQIAVTTTKEGTEPQAYVTVEETLARVTDVLQISFLGTRETKLKECSRKVSRTKPRRELPKTTKLQ